MVSRQSQAMVNQRARCTAGKAESSPRRYTEAQAIPRWEIKPRSGSFGME